MHTMNCDQNCNLLDAKALGNWGEDIARQYIEQQGLKIVTTNYKTKAGEIDIIAKNGLTYHFIEIKARRGVTHGLPREAVSKRKQKHIKQAAMYFIRDLRAQNRKWKELSFDVVEVYVHEDLKATIHYMPQCFM